MTETAHTVPVLYDTVLLEKYSQFSSNSCCVNFYFPKSTGFSTSRNTTLLMPSLNTKKLVAFLLLFIQTQKLVILRSNNNKKTMENTRYCRYLSFDKDDAYSDEKVETRHNVARVLHQLIQVRHLHINETSQRKIPLCTSLDFLTKPI
jgi:hypothetical protein